MPPSYTAQSRLKSRRGLPQVEEAAGANKNKKILFVDQENSCPSVIAEAIWKHMGPNMALGWTAASAGLKVRGEGGEMDSRTSQILKQFAVPEYGKRTRLFKDDDLHNYGTILCNDDASLAQVRGRLEAAQDDLQAG